MTNILPRRNIGLDLMRGLSIFYIVGFWHMFNYTNTFPLYYNVVSLRFTWVVLSTFVFISGYFIGRRKIELSKKCVFQFYKNRLLRILPLYITALLIFYCLGLLDASTTLKSAFGLSMFLKPAPTTLWFITMILIFYAVSPLLRYIVEKNELYYAMLMYVGVFALLMGYSYITANLDVRIVAYLPSFYLGMVVSVKGQNFISKKSMAALLLIGLVCTFIFNQRDLQLDCLIALPLLTAAPFFILILFKDLIKVPVFLNRAISVLAYASYSMYLFHRPIYMEMKKIYFPEQGIHQIAYLYAVCLPLILIVSYFVQKLYDNGLDSLGKAN